MLSTFNHQLSTSLRRHERDGSAPIARTGAAANGWGKYIAYHHVIWHGTIPQRHDFEFLGIDDFMHAPPQWPATQFALTILSAGCLFMGKLDDRPDET
jgi:hypothetical protein